MGREQAPLPIASTSVNKESDATSPQPPQPPHPTQLLATHECPHSHNAALWLSVIPGSTTTGERRDLHHVSHAATTQYQVLLMATFFAAGYLGCTRTDVLFLQNAHFRLVKDYILPRWFRSLHFHFHFQFPLPATSSPGEQSTIHPRFQPRSPNTKIEQGIRPEFSSQPPSCHPPRNSRKAPDTQPATSHSVSTHTTWK